MLLIFYCVFFFPAEKTPTLTQCTNSVIWSICDSGHSHTTATLSFTSAPTGSDTGKPVRLLTVTQVIPKNWIYQYKPRLERALLKFPSVRFTFFTLMWVLQIFIILHFAEEVIRKRKETRKDENELERIQAKRNLDFLDILLSAIVNLVLLSPEQQHCSSRLVDKLCRLIWDRLQNYAVKLIAVKLTVK